MDKHSPYYTISETQEKLIISDKLKLDWREISLFLMPMIVASALLFAPHYIVSLVICVLFISVYIPFRFMASFIYSNFSINKLTKEVKLEKFRFNKIISSEIIDSNYDFKNVEFIPQKRSGFERYTLTYNTYKKHQIIVLKSLEVKLEVEEVLKNL